MTIKNEHLLPLINKAKNVRIKNKIYQGRWILDQSGLVLEWGMKTAY